MTTRMPCYWDGWHRPHRWNVIGEDWRCPGAYGLTALRLWRASRRWRS